jgi:glycosyltransferase involved in cell wall biosynthesis
MPRALQEVGLLEKLVTDIYVNLPGLPGGNILGQRYPKLLARSSPGLTHRQVSMPAGATLRTLLQKGGLGNHERQAQLDQIIGRKARELAWRTNAALFSYSYYAGAAFATGSERPPIRLLFQLHPHPAAVRAILQEEMRRVPKFAASLRHEHEIGSSEAHFQLLCAEPQLANGWVVASSFTAKTLAEQGIPRKEIHVVPYGVDTTHFPCRDQAPGAGEPFRVIWIGSMAQRKGLSYFLEAIGSLPQENLEVLICGYQAMDQTVIEEYGIRSVRVFKGLPTAELTKLLRACDLFVLPSLAEGFGHVILEAMSSGVPILTTASTCAADIAEDGLHGFIVAIRDAASIAKRITWGRQHRKELFRMGLAGAVRARTFTWERFRQGVVNAYEQMVQNQLTPVSADGRNGSKSKLTD